MKCPKLKHRRQQELGLEIAFFGDCLKEECAWWFSPTDRCAIFEVAVHLREADARLGKIIDKMPPARE